MTATSASEQFYADLHKTLGCDKACIFCDGENFGKWACCTRINGITVDDAGRCHSKRFTEEPILCDQCGNCHQCNGCRLADGTRLSTSTTARGIVVACSGFRWHP